jgi:hypothetical protein
MQAHHLAASGVLDQRLQHGPRRFKQFGPQALYQVSPLGGQGAVRQLLLRWRQHAMKADDKDITEEVRVNVFWPTANVVLREATDALGDNCLDFSLHVTSLSVLYPRSARLGPFYSFWPTQQKSPPIAGRRVAGGVGSRLVPTAALASNHRSSNTTNRQTD